MAARAQPGEEALTDLAMQTPCGLMHADPPPPQRLQATQEVLSQLPLTTTAEFNAAVQSAKDAYPKWRSTPVSTRARVMFKLQELIRAHTVSEDAS
jgi:acyl-CoA reductase-like NAD-dependent aldehyde dehydrogenase